MAVLTPTGSDAPTRLVSIPFALPGELVRIHLHRHEPDYFMSHGDLLEILEPSERRKADVQELPGRTMDEAAAKKLAEVRAKYGNRVQCQYFGECSGCQVRPLPETRGFVRTSGTDAFPSRLRNSTSLSRMRSSWR